MSNPGVIFLARFHKDNINFAVEDNIGEAVHIHLYSSFINVRLDLTVKEFLEIAGQIEGIIDRLSEKTKREIPKFFMSDNYRIQKREIIQTDNKIDHDFEQKTKAVIFYKKFPTLFGLKSCKRLKSDRRFIVDHDIRISDLKDSCYKIQNIALKDLYGTMLSKDGCNWISCKIADLPEYKYLLGIQEPYADYVNFKSPLLNDGNTHGRERYNNLIASLEKYGYNKRNIIFVNEKNYIFAGKHRAAWLYKRYGPEYEIQVVKIYEFGNINAKVVPRWFGRICCLFIFKSKNRKLFRNKYIKGA
jgi:hypothetical protein